MGDDEVLGRINELAREEHELFDRESHGTVTDADRERLRRLELTLDQCWDLLRQGRARRAAGLNPDEAKVRDERTVKGYIGCCVRQILWAPRFDMLVRVDADTIVIGAGAAGLGAARSLAGRSVRVLVLE